MFSVRWCLLFSCVVTIIGRNGCSPREMKVQASHLKEPSEEDLRKAMRHHGILFAEQGEDGDWYFHRNGKQYRLFAYQGKSR